MQLRRDAQLQIQVERVVMRDERARRGAAGLRLQNRRLDLHEAFAVQELADRADDQAARAEKVADVLIGDQIQMALAVADFNVGKAVPFFRQRQERLGQQSPGRHFKRLFPALGGEERAFGFEHVAEVDEVRETFERFRADRVQFQMQLQLARFIGQIGESRSPMRAHGADAARERQALSFSAPGLEMRNRFRAGGGATRVGRIRVDAGGAQLFDFLSPNDFFFEHTSRRCRGFRNRACCRSA